jgi:hypothetical protein
MRDAGEAKYRARPYDGDSMLNRFVPMLGVTVLAGITLAAAAAAPAGGKSSTAGKDMTPSRT